MHIPTEAGQSLQRLAHTGHGPSLRAHFGPRLPRHSRQPISGRSPCRIHALDDKTKEQTEQTDAKTATEKYGLEAGLFKVFTSKDKSGKSRTQQAKELLSVYGGAYLITSISFAIISFAICYGLVSRGVDVPSLLDRFGLRVGGTGEKVGTVAIAYAAHKALSPVRFPPTVALTPVVARFIGKRAVNPEQAEKIDPNT